MRQLATSAALALFATFAFLLRAMTLRHRAPQLELVRLVDQRTRELADSNAQLVRL